MWEEKRSVAMRQCEEKLKKNKKDEGRRWGKVLGRLEVHHQDDQAILSEKEERREKEERKVIKNNNN